MATCYTYGAKRVQRLQYLGMLSGNIWSNAQYLGMLSSISGNAI